MRFAQIVASSVMLCAVLFSSEGGKADDSTFPPKQPVGELKLDQLAEILSRAAAITKDQFEAIESTGRADGVPGCLTMVVLRLPFVRGITPTELRDFNGLNNASALTKAMLYEDGGIETYSVLQPNYIKRLLCIVNGDRGRGVAEFEAPKAYRGRVEFEVEFSHSRWRVTAFRFAGRGIRTALSDDGSWKVVEGREILGLKSVPLDSTKQ